MQRTVCLAHPDHVGETGNAELWTGAASDSARKGKGHHGTFPLDKPSRLICCYGCQGQFPLSRASTSRPLFRAHEDQGVR